MAKTKSKVDVSTLNTWEQICAHKGISPDVPFDVSMLDAATQNFLIAAYKLPIIIEVRNNDPKFPDYTKTDQYKYELWPRIHADKKRPSGFALSYHGYDYWSTTSFVGVRFAFKSRGIAESTFEDFKQLFEHFFLKIS